jgi:hypothetical protein
MTSRSASLSQSDILELVLEYLSSSGFSEAENALKKEIVKSTEVAKKAATSSQSRLEDLLEKSYVTELASGEYFPRKKVRRTHLDALLLQEELPIEVARYWHDYFFLNNSFHKFQVFRLKP